MCMNEYMNDLNETVYSYTKLHMFDICPLSYKFNYIDKIERIPPAYFLKGLISHKILEMYGKYRDVDVALSKTIEKYGSFELTMDTFHDIKDYLVESFFKNAKYFEYPIQFDIVDDNNQKRRIYGVIDRIDYDEESGLYEIIDYKYGNTNYTVNNSIQTTLYVLGFFEVFNVDSVKFSYINVKKKNVSSKIFYKNEVNKTYILSLINNIENAVKTNIFPPKVGDNCLVCQYAYMCPAFRVYIQNGTALKISNIEELVDNYVMLNEKINTEKKMLYKIEDMLRKYMSYNKTNVLESNNYKIVVNDKITITKK